VGKEKEKQVHELQGRIEQTEMREEEIFILPG
jgi:hypothetical protein